MIRLRQLSCILLLILCLFLLGGCASGKGWIPTSFAGIDEAYPQGGLLGSASSAPSESMRKSVFNAPYQDVFRAASISVSQAQWFLQKEDKAGGAILATRILQIQPPPGISTCPAGGGYNLHPTQRNFYYAVLINEKGPKSTEVSVFVKAQGRCFHTTRCFGHSEYICDEYASLHWATVRDNALPDLTQFLTFVRNNLIAAGLL